jgi:tRNA pseudouridine55 synthase
VNLDKPLGLGSTQAVGAIKRGLRDAGLMASGRGSKANRIKVGHGGTLDPLATGVLPIALGEATKLTGRMLDASKSYDFTIEFGTQTDTLDREGAVIATSDVRPTLAEVEAVLPRFTGPIEQAPPAYSAILIDGQRAYDLARAGREVEMKTRGVRVHSLDIVMPVGAGERLDSVTLTAHVSKGTYIRSLARDIALALKTVGHVTMLRRTKAGPFGLADAISLDNWADAANARALDTLILPFEAGLDDIPALSLSSGDAGAIRQGRVLAGMLAEDGLYCATDGDVPVALVELGDGHVRVVRGFNFDQ